MNVIDKMDKCPKCGSEANIRINSIRNLQSSDYYIECGSCGLRTNSYNHTNEAINCWNNCNGLLLPEMKENKLVLSKFSPDEKIDS